MTDLHAIPDLGRVAVLMGGCSAEREISLRSGQAVLDALIERQVDAFAVDIGADMFQQIGRLQADRVFIALHGRGGEDGKVQALLETRGLPYTGSGLMAAAITMDKLKTKQIWVAEGIATPAYSYVSHQTPKAQWASLSYPLVVKPIHEGSSIGISMVADAEQLEPALQEAFKYDERVLLEQFIQGREFTVGILNQQALPVIQLKPAAGFYDYHAKYLAEDTQYLIPSGLSVADEQALQELALRAFKAVGCRGWGRVDAMQNAKGEFFLLEANTVPGMTDHSLVPMAARAAGLTFADLVLQILAGI